MTHRSQLADKNRKRRIHRTEYRRELEKAFKTDKQAAGQTEPQTTDAKA